MDFPEDQGIALVARRVDFLERLQSGPLHKRDLVESLDHSRSTVDRAIDELQEAGLVARETEGWVTTQTGRLATEQYRAFLTDQESILTARGLLDAVPNDRDLPASLLSGAEVVPEGDANRLFETLAEELASADRYRALVPTLVDSRHLRLCHARVLRDGLDAELVTTGSVLDRTSEEFPHLASELASADSFQAHAGAVPPFGLLLTTGTDSDPDGDADRDADPDGDADRDADPDGDADRDADPDGDADRDADPDWDADPELGSGSASPDRGDGEAGGTSLIFVAYEDGEIAGFLRTDAERAVDWARGIYADARGDGEPATEELASGSGTADLPPMGGERLPARLRSEGFVRVDDRYFDCREPMDPATGWRAGLGLPEVAEGHAVERRPGAAGEGSDADPEVDGDSGPDADATAAETDPEAAAEWTGEASSLTESLLERLRDGESVAVVGPPGAGKSTVCKRVAYRYHEADEGVVLYRESGMGQPFESTGALETVLDRRTRPTLVVVEDAVRDEANAVFEVMRAFEDVEDVSFLLDARTGEWRDPGEFPADARLDAFRRGAVETVRIPPIDDREATRLVDRFESLTGRSLDVSGPDLLADVRAARSDDGTVPGTAFLFFHRLARYADPLDEGPADRSTLDDAVDSLRVDLAGIGETALDAGVLAHLLNAAGVGVYPDYLHAVAGSDDGHSAEGRREDGHGQVAAAVERMAGNVFFPRPEGSPYRGIHGAWSARFLARFLDDRGEAGARRRVGRCCSALLSLADGVADDGSDGRGGTDDGVSVGTSADSLARDPAGWADRTVEALFEVGRTYPKLAALFGDGESVSVELPRRCSVTETDCLLWNARAFLAAGEYDRAQQAFEAPGELAGDRRVDRLLGLSAATFERGEYDAATDYARRCLDVARDLDCEHARARARSALGRIAEKRGEYDRARDHLQAALDRFEALEDRRRTADVLSVLGSAAEAQGEYDRARRHHERSLDLRRSVGDSHGEAESHNELGLVAQRRSAYDRAETHYRRALSIHRTVGDRAGQAKSYNRLGIVAFRRGEYDEATRWYRRSLSIRRRLGDRQSEASTLMNLGTVALRQGEYDRARERLRRAVEINDDLGNKRGKGTALANLGVVAESLGDFEGAREYHERALAINREIGHRKAVSAVLTNLATAEHNLGEYDRARERCEEALEIKREIGNREGEANAHITLGTLARDRGDYDRAVECLEAALAIAESIDSNPLRAEATTAIAATDLLRGDCELGSARAAEALELVAELDDPQKTVDAHLVAARAAMYRGALGEAEDYLAAVRDAAEGLTDPVSARFPVVLGELRRRQERFDDAESRLSTGLSTAGDLGLAPLAARCRERLARLARDRGDRAAARAHAADAVETARTVGCPHHEVDALCSLASVGVTEGLRATDGGVSGGVDRSGTDEATDRSPVEVAEEALSTAREAGYWPGLARASLVLGRVARREGATGRARRRLRAAVELAAEAGHEPLTDRSRRALSGVESGD